MDRNDSPWRKDIVCGDCGLLLKNVYSNTKRCPTCARVHARKRNRYRHLETGRTKSLVKSIPTLDHRYCEGCVYYGGDYEITKCCNYIFIEDKRRPCPPGKDCTVKVKRRSKA